MHRQIGNAVPLPVGHALGREVRKVLYKKWKINLDEAICIDDDDDDKDYLKIAETLGGIAWTLIKVPCIYIS